MIKVSISNNTILVMWLEIVAMLWWWSAYQSHSGCFGQYKNLSLPRMKPRFLWRPSRSRPLLSHLSYSRATTERKRGACMYVDYISRNSEKMNSLVWVNHFYLISLLKGPSKLC